MEAEYASSSLEQNVSMSPQEFTPTNTMEMQPKQKTKQFCSMRTTKPAMEKWIKKNIRKKNYTQLLLKNGDTML